eukprot:scaffold313181_cov18-Prasinocladus_malaysianus.AAC.1
MSIRQPLRPSDPVKFNVFCVSIRDNMAWSDPLNNNNNTIGNGVQHKRSCKSRKRKVIRALSGFTPWWEGMIGERRSMGLVNQWSLCVANGVCKQTIDSCAFLQGRASSQSIGHSLVMNIVLLIYEA